MRQRAMRQYAEAHLDVERMADATEAVYARARKSMTRGGDEVLLCGYYGFGNAGDEALLRASIARAREKFGDAGVSVLMPNGRARDGALFGLKTVSRRNPFAIWRAVRRARVVVFGGGTLLQELTSRRSLWYYTALLRYNKILDQRNSLLKNHDVSLILDTLPIWDEQLCKYAALIIKKRAEFIEKLAPFAKEYHAYLTDGAEELIVKPDRRYEGDEQEIANLLAARLANNYEKDLRLGFTTVGPHRDDLDVIINGIDAKSYASQGQMRTAALALKLAEVNIFKTLSGEYPILVLDDVMSELDLKRRKKLLQCIKEVQTILTCTHTERVLYGAECNKIRIESGHISKKA